MLRWIGMVVMVGSTLTACSDPSLSGELSVATSTRASTTIAPAECTESWSTRGAGVEFWEEDGWWFDFRHDSVAGPSLQVSTPRGEEVVLTPRDCQQFRGELRRHTEHEEQIVHVTSGSLSLRCAQREGVLISGELTFHRCVQR